jgi:putative CocE/NonD family hydrolase
MIGEAAGGAMGTANNSYRFMGVFEGGIALLDEAVEWFMEKGGAKYKHEHGMGYPASEQDLRSLPVIGMIGRGGGPQTDWDQMLAHSISDPWWGRFDGLAENDSIHIPALHVNSWFDYGVAETLYMFNLFQQNATNQTARNNQHCIIYPTKHCCFGDASDSTGIGTLFLGDARLNNFGLYLEWCDFWLKVEDNSLIDLPKVLYYVMGKNEWRQDDEWPPDEVEYTKFYLASNSNSSIIDRGGLLSSEAPDKPTEAVIVYDPSDPAPSYKWPGAIDMTLISD